MCSSAHFQWGEWTRRGALSAAAIMFSSSLLGQSPAAARSRLILLGTKGGPTPSKARAPAANVLIVDDIPYVIDAPDGVARQLVLANVELPSLGNIFITHHHSDHNAGLGSLLLLAWGAGLKTPVSVHGPPPLSQLLQAHLESAAFDIDARIKEEGRPRLQSLVKTNEVTGGSRALDDGRVRVTTALVNHYTVPNIAYRFDTPGRSFVFSGDTAPSPALIALARGADVLVHEVMLESALDRIADGNAPTLRDHLVKSHTTTEQLGRIASLCGVKTLVLSHLVPAFPDIPEAEWSKGVRKHFAGEIIVGRDLMTI